MASRQPTRVGWRLASRQPNLGQEGSKDKARDDTLGQEGPKDRIEMASRQATWAKKAPRID